MSQKHSSELNSGFSLIELLITLAIGSIIMGIAAPNLSDLIDSSRLTTTSNGFVSAHIQARSEAVSRGKTVSICKSNNATSASPNCGDDDVAWSDGWVVFVNEDGDVPAAIDTGEEVLRVAAALRPRYTLAGSDSVANGISYNLMGEIASPGLFILCRDNKISEARALLTSHIGHIRNTTLTAAGVPSDADGQALTSCTP